ncbi:hypothetical protein RIF29_41254 [Crotalaria pallida]|uniref:Uncharacterized protein n=1 Tax=Crotalaria pallida TaxID=3830 RepID=A0AAN9E621_CROPI
MSVTTPIPSRILPLLLLLSALPSSVTCCYTSIFSFGDSLTDTGNLRFIYPPQVPNCLLPPYGETHFHHPTGRCSDGRLILDFIAEAVGIPYVKPYLALKNGEVKGGDIGKGVNFAVGGATAIEGSFYEEKGFAVSVTANYSLRVQLGWFKELLPSLCNSSSLLSCKNVLHSSLFIVGEIGGNDYGYPLSKTKAFEEPRTYIPQVISVISSVIEELIDLEAVTLIVPGSLPLGCNPAYLTRFATVDEEEYDEGGCLIWLNQFFEYHNEQLQIEINRLRGLYPHTNIIYADYFNAALRFYRSPEQFGFGENVVKVCCGGGGPYNYNETAMCGSSGVIPCHDPSQYVSWDGYHLTEAAHRWITKGLINGPYTNPKFIVSCVTAETFGDFNNYAKK